MHPYGSSAYRSVASGVEVSARRYRYTGKERDEETGLDYFGARYYAPWLGRWTTADPLGLQAGVNLYLYGRASPVVMVDPNGLDTVTSEEIKFRQRQNAVPREGPLHLTGEDPNLYKDESTEIRRGPGGRPEYVTKAPDLSGVGRPSEGASRDVPQPPGFERGQAEPPEPYTFKQLVEDLFFKPFVGESGAPTGEADLERQRPRIGEGEFAFNVAVARLAIGKGKPGALANAERVAGDAARAEGRAAAGGAASYQELITPKQARPFLEEAKKRAAASKERLGNPSDDIVNMAMPRKKALERIDSLTPQLEKHLEKIANQPGSRDVNHWRTEAKAWIQAMEEAAPHTGKKTSAELAAKIAAWKRRLGE